MKIKDTLDLCGWGLHNFCIQNHDDLETLQNLGLGRKIFYTGNSNDKHHREVIYDGSTWKVSAYMSDVESVQSNLSALTERVNAFLDGEVNSNEVLDNLKEIQAFLDAYPEATSLVQILDTKLDKTGGTIKGSSEHPLIIDTYGEKIGLYFGVKGSIKTEVGWDGSNGAYLYNYVTGEQLSLAPTGGAKLYINSKFETLLHSGNYVDLIGDTYLKTTGGTIKKAEEDNAPLFIENVGTSWTGIGFKNKNGILGFLGANDGNPVFVDSSFASHTIAFTDSNVASAQALAHSNGTVGATVSEAGNLCINGKISSADDSLNLFEYSAGYLYLGYSLRNEHTTRVYGNKIEFLTGDTQRMLINSSGNVLIGATNDNGAKLQVNGSVSFKDEINVWEGTTKNRLTFYEYQGIGRIYSYNNTDNTFGDLCIGNNIGDILKVKANGNILIGTPSPLNETSKLQIKGDLYVEGNIIATKEVSAGGAATEGNGGAGGFSLYESWGTSAPTEPLALGANLGYELKTNIELLGTDLGDRITTLEGRVTDSVYSKTESDARYLKLTGGTISGDLTINQYLQIKAWEGYGSGVAKLWFSGNDKTLQWQDVEKIKIGTNVILHSGNYSDYALPLTGGTMKDASTINWGGNLVGWDDVSNGFIGISNFKGDSTFGYYVGLSFKGYYGFQIRSYGGGDLYEVRGHNSSNWGTWRTLLHSGNVGEYALKTDGSNAMQSSLNMGANVIAWGVNNGLQYLGTNADGASLAFFGNGFSDWKTIAFTDSDITGNAATATVAESAKTLLSAENFKLFYTYPNINTWSLGYYTHHGNLDFETLSFRYGSGYNTAMLINSSGNVTIGESDLASTTTKLYVDGGIRFAPRTIWGQSFDGTGNVSGDLSLGNSSIQGGASSVNMLVYDASNTLYLGYGMNGVGGSVICGEAIAMRYGGSRTMGFLLNSSGNVTIGDQDLAGDYHKLYVNGHSGFAGNIDIYSGGRIQTYSNPLIINNLGNNVLIGTTTDNGAKLQVNGEVSSLGMLKYGFSSSDSWTDGNGKTHPWFGISLNYHNNGVFSTTISDYYGLTLKTALGYLAMDINGKVGIGTTEPDEKLHVVGNLHVTGNIIADGEVSAGGAGTEGGNTGGGGTGTITNPYVVTFTPSNETSHSFYHNLPYYDVVVQVYEKNAISGAWDMILADVTIANESRLVTVDFGRKENVEHKIVVR